MGAADPTLNVGHHSRTGESLNERRKRHADRSVANRDGNAGSRIEIAAGGGPFGGQRRVSVEYTVVPGGIAVCRGNSHAATTARTSAAAPPAAASAAGAVAAGPGRSQTVQREILSGWGRAAARPGDRQIERNAGDDRVGRNLRQVELDQASMGGRRTILADEDRAARTGIAFAVLENIAIVAVVGQHDHSGRQP